MTTWAEFNARANGIARLLVDAPALREGYIAIRAGIYDTVLAVGVEKLAGAGMLGGGGGAPKVT